MADLPPLNSQFIVLNLNIIIIKVKLILSEISGRNYLPLKLLALFIRITPINKAAGKERIFAIAFPILYLISRADFNASRLWEVPLNKYT